VNRTGEWGDVAVPLEDQAVVLFRVSLADAATTVALVKQRLLLATAFALALALALGLLAAGVLARRLLRLENAAERIAGGDFGHPVIDRGDDEIGQLAQAFDRMRVQLAQLDTARKEFVANASHELRTPLFSIAGYDFSWRDLILLAGGLFLLVKGTREIHQDFAGEDEEGGPAPVADTMVSAILQIAIIDLVFSVDSIITAVGMADHVEVMVAAVAVAILVMYFASGPVADFIERHPTTKMLALSFLLLIGAALVADGMHFHIPRAYIYFAMAFAAAVEVVNVMAAQRRRRAKEKARAQRPAKG
jgi:predicted tellurium resistance membrane protein TerC/HAMP domain-containing protein